MARHHTKDKGDLGVAKVHADLASKGFTVLFPATEHAPFDIVAYTDGEFHRLQVKYRSARSGAVIVKFRSMWADRNGTHTVRRSLWIAPSKNRQHVGVLVSEAFREMPRPLGR